MSSTQGIETSATRRRVRIAEAIQWPPIFCIAAGIAQGMALPRQYRFLEREKLMTVILLAGLLVATSALARWRGHQLAAGRATGMLAGLLAFLTTRSLLVLLGLVYDDAGLRGWTLLQLAANVWTNNILTFALCFWLLDRGGPTARARGESAAPDWLFPEMTSPFARPDWRPNFIDYLYLALTNATAFSPTDTLPLSARARGLMAVEAVISLITLALVAARAVNVLG